MDKIENQASSPFRYRAGRSCIEHLIKEAEAGRVLIGDVEFCKGVVQIPFNGEMITVRTGWTTIAIQVYRNQDDERFLESLPPSEEIEDEDEDWAF